MPHQENPSPIEVINLLQVKPRSFHVYFESYRIVFSENTYVSVTDSTIELVENNQVKQSFNIENYSANQISSLVDSLLA